MSGFTSIPGMTFQHFFNHSNGVIGTATIFPECVFEKHYHKEDEKYYITSGTGFVFLDDQWIPAKEGDVFELPAGCVHSCKTESPQGISFIYYFPKGPFEKIEYLTK